MKNDIISLSMVLLLLSSNLLGYEEPSKTKSLKEGAREMVVSAATMGGTLFLGGINIITLVTGLIAGYAINGLISYVGDRFINPYIQWIGAFLGSVIVFLVCKKIYI